MYPLAAGLVIENREIREAMVAALDAASVRVLFEAPEFPQEPGALLDRLNRVRPDVVLIDLAALKRPMETVVQEIRSSLGQPAVFIVHTHADSDAILGALRSGASEFQYPPFEQPFRDALERLAKTRESRQDNQRQGGKAIGFLSAKGGCGATTLACHTAREIAAYGTGSVLLADFDFETGLIGFLAKTKSDYSVTDAVRNIQRLDASYWRALISNGIPNLEIIAAPGTPVAKDVPAGALKQVVAFARTQYDWLVFDLGRNVNSRTLSVLDLIDETYIVTTAEVPALHQAKQLIRVLLQGGYPQDRLRLVLNRAPRRMDVSLDELGEMLGVPVFASVDNDYQSLQEAYTEGRLLESGGNLGRSIAALADRITGHKRAKKKFSLFG